MEHDCHPNTFVERVLKRDQPAVGRELIHAATNLTPVFKQHQRKNRAAELDARSPWSFRSDGSGGHSRSILHQSASPGQITKVRLSAWAAPITAFPSGGRGRAAHAAPRGRVGTAA